LQGLPDWLHRILAFLFQGKPPYPMIAPALFAHLRRRGVHVWFLGVNTEADLRIAISSGATAVLTDRIHWLKETMEKEKLRFAKVAQ
jgi:glycerophosphoryl diester phosphodiesterase